MSDTPYVFEFAKEDPVLSKLSSYLNRNPSKKTHYVIEETCSNVTFIYIETAEDADFFLINVFLPTRNNSTDTPPEYIEYILFKHIPFFTDQINLLEHLIEKDESRKKLLKIEESEETYTITVPSSVSPEQYLRRLFLVDEMERIKMDKKRIQDKKLRKVSNLYNIR